MVPCVSCRRHIKADESVCPFCGAAQSASATAPERVSAPDGSDVPAYGIPPSFIVEPKPLDGPPPDAPMMPAYGMPPVPQSSRQNLRVFFALLLAVGAGVLWWLWP
ncbi:MAG: hypothetical protein AAF411_01415 [Myxococcota bacterium]